MKKSEISKDDSVFRFYKGEQENPFSQDTANPAYNFWGYELLFEEKFNQCNFSSEMWIPTNTPDINEWLSVLNTEPVDKEELFKIWLFNLLMVHLPEKYQMKDDHFLKLYWETEL